MLDDIARRAMQSHVKASLKKLPKKVAPPVIEAGYAGQVIDLAQDYANKSPAVLQIRNRRRPGAGTARANRATSRKPAHSVIFSESKAIKDAYPNEWETIKAEVESWTRGGYIYARDVTTGTVDMPMKDYPKWIGPDGRRWRLKSKARFGQGYRLSAIDKGKLKGYGKFNANKIGPDMAKSVDGEIPATLWKISGDLDLELLYGNDGEWLGSRFYAGGSQAEFLLKQSVGNMHSLWKV